MKFVDEAILSVKAGDGGRGCVSFRREPFVPRGGPNGGDGGKGGDVVIVGKGRLISLLDFTYKRLYKAESGKGGGGRNRAGRNGADLMIYVPLGTEVRDQNGFLLADIVEEGQTYVAARGGRGGRGNARFATPVHRTPTEFEEGEKGEERPALKVELKLLARIGIIGLPNAGKSTLLSRLTAASPEVGDYPFTTLTPSLGVLVEGDRRLVLADIPGIIEGASRGKGLGLTFLRHIERTRMLLWVIDASSTDVSRDYATLATELRLYKKELVSRERIVALNKIDLVRPETLAGQEAFFREAGETAIAVSAVAGYGLERLKKLLAERDGDGADG
jgi:GTP-binding protein